MSKKGGLEGWGTVIVACDGKVGQRGKTHENTK
jgi:hypothetical protein